MGGRIRSAVYTSDGRFRTPWRLLVAVVLLVVVQLGVALVFGALGVPVDPTQAGGPALLVALVAFAASGLAVAAATLLAARYLDRRRLEDIGVPLGGYRWADFGVGLGLGVGLVGGAYLVGIAAGVYEPRLAPSGPAGYPVAVWLAALVGVMVVVGVYEELLLRGYLLTNLAEGLTALLDDGAAVIGAIAVSSLGFGVLHGANPNATAVGVLTIALAGVLLGLGYVCTDSLALPIGVHITWNLTHVAVGVPVSGLDLGIRVLETAVSGPKVVHGGAFGPEGGLLGLAATVCGCAFVVGYARLTGRGLTGKTAVPSLRE
jgi:hypothetical protein